MRLVALATCLGGWCAGRPAVEVAVMAAACLVPVPALVLLSVVAFRRASGGNHDHRSEDALVLVRISAELRSGGNLRQAIATAAEEDPRFHRAARLARGGRPMTEVAEELSSRMHRFGPEVAAALRVCTAAGGSPSPALEELAGQVLALDDLARERRAAMAPGVLQAGILGGATAIGVVWMASSGRLAASLATGGLPAALVVAGLGAIVLGGLLVIRMVRR